MHKKTALIVGATGIIGSHILEHLKTLNDWDAIGIVRQIPKKYAESYISMDLLNEEDIRLKLKSLRNVTHIFYAAYQDFPAFSKEQVEVNTGMLRNIVNAVEETPSPLERIILMQGAK